MVMLLSDAEYLARAGVPFVIPLHPGEAPLLCTRTLVLMHTVDFNAQRV
jgi:hypothetical protein